MSVCLFAVLRISNYNNNGNNSLFITFRCCSCMMCWPKIPEKRTYIQNIHRIRVSFSYLDVLYEFYNVYLNRWTCYTLSWKDLDTFENVIRWLNVLLLRILLSTFLWVFQSVLRNVFWDINNKYEIRYEDDEGKKTQDLAQDKKAVFIIWNSFLRSRT